MGAEAAFSGGAKSLRGAVLAAFGFLIFSTGCASTTPAGTRPDPLEGMNRAFFSFNICLDDYALGPVARGYKKVTPAPMRRSVSNFFYNVDFPERLVSSIGQAEAGKAATEVARFGVNTTVGLAGLFDPASHFGLGKYDEDLGQMMGRWGIPGGPYWVLPILGPSNPRDTAGFVAQRFLNPFFWLDYFETNYVSLGTGTFNILNARAEADEEIASARQSALDYYVFVRDAYQSRREAQIRDEEPPESGTGDEAQDDLYDDLYDEPDSGDTDEQEESTSDQPLPELP